MRKNDKLLCKNKIFNFECGKYYRILFINSVSTSEYAILGERTLIWRLYSVYNDYPYQPYIWDYFYTKQEERKLKLKELSC